MNKQEEIREGIASRIYLDWNKDKNHLTWESLPNYRKQSYRDWVEIHLFQYLKSQGVVLKADMKLPFLENNKGEWKTPLEYKRDIEKMKFWEELI